jgi:hypothetical protein
MKTIKTIHLLVIGLSLICFTSCIDLFPDKHPDQRPAAMAEGLVVFFDFNDNLNDQSGNGQNGTIFGGRYVSELGDNESFNFNGNGDYIKVANDLLLNPANAITISVWFKPVDYHGTGYDGLVLKPFTSHEAPYYQYILGIAGSHGISPYNFAFNVNINGINTGINSGANTWIPGIWYNIVGMFDGQSIKLYVNGILKNSSEVKGSITGYDTDLFLARQPNLSLTTPGTMDNVRIYQRALPENEVKDLYMKDYK